MKAGKGFPARPLGLSQPQALLLCSYRGFTQLLVPSGLKQPMTQIYAG